MRFVLFFTVGLLCLSACDTHESSHTERGSASSRHEDQRKKCDAHVPPGSRGRKPAGTRDDPFVGYGVVVGLWDVSSDLVRVGIRHRAIPHFKIAAEMAVNLPKPIAADVEAGDFVTFRYARLPESSSLAKLYWSGERPQGPVQYVYCGYEVFAVDVVSDSEFPAR